MVKTRRWSALESCSARRATVWSSDSCRPLSAESVMGSIGPSPIASHRGCRRSVSHARKNGTSLGSLVLPFVQSVMDARSTPQDRARAAFETPRCFRAQLRRSFHVTSVRAGIGPRRELDTVSLRAFG
jgi:hypothetical protein